jgi:parallel beta-helix repeat protein
MRKPIYYLVIAMLFLGIVEVALPFNNLNVKAATPDDGIDGYQELHEDWIVTGYEEYTDEIIALYGDLTIENSGHLVLFNCTLMLMSITLAPYSIIVKNGGILEMYDCYITDPPNDDDTEFLSAYYYFIARQGSELIIENSIIRQCGFIDISNPEHMGVFIGTNRGHISDTTINTSVVALSFRGNNTGFLIENINISQIGMTPLIMANCRGVSINNVTFFEVGENYLVDTQQSYDFKIENLTLTEEQVIRFFTSSGFSIKNIHGNDVNRLIRIEDCDDFTVQNVMIDPGEMWNRKIELSRCSNFTIDNISISDDQDVMIIEDSSNGTISNIVAYNITRFVDIWRSDNIEISDVNIVDGSELLRSWDCNQVIMDNINLKDVSSPIYMNSTDNSSISNLNIWALEGTGILATYSSNNINISNAYLESISMDHTTGLFLESSRVNIRDYSTFNINLSIRCWSSYMLGENILINGTYEPYSGIEIENALDIYLSNITILNPRFYGIKLQDCQGGNVRIHNVYVNDSSTGIDFTRADATLSNLSFKNVNQDIQTWDNSHLTVMNSTIDRYRLVDSEIICIDAVNASSCLMFGSSSLIWKWWVDVYVEDSWGKVAGAKVDIWDDPGPVEIQSITGSDGFARNIPVTEVVWTPGPIADYITPHYARAYETGWEAFSISYIVNSNMQMNVFYFGNTPPNAPTNMAAFSDESSNTILTWDPSTSWDVAFYDIYIARDTTSLNNYMMAGIPNASVPAPQCDFVHESGSEDWELYHYAVKSNDSVFDSTRYAKANCGDWVINKSTPQYIESENITLYGSLWIFGHLELGNTSLQIGSWPSYVFGIFVNNSGYFKCENVSIARENMEPYFFYISQDAQAVINGSRILYPGDEVRETEWYLKGIQSYSGNLTITNSIIEARYWGLGIYGVHNFLGVLDNITFYSHPWERAEYILHLSESSNIDLTGLKMYARTNFGIYANSVSSLDISLSNISLEGGSNEFSYGIFMHQCTDSRIHNNTLILGNPGIFILDSENITIESSNISAWKYSGIHIESSLNTTIQRCSFVRANGNVDNAIYMSWCMYSTIRDIVGDDNQQLIKMENESQSKIENVTHTAGEVGIWLINSDNLLLMNIYLDFIQTGIRITGCRDITLFSVTINLTINCFVMDSFGPINMINCSLSNGINGEVIAKGYEGELGILIMDNSSIKAFGGTSLVLNDSAVVFLLNTSVNLSKLVIEDSGSRVELYHYLSVQVYDIDNNIPLLANISIMNTKDNMVYTKQVSTGYAQWILIHEKTIFKNANYTDNPYRIFFDDGSHYGETWIYINESQHLDVQVSNIPPIILWVNIGPANPKTDSDIVLNYMYEDPENDPESGTIIHWYVNGVFNSTFTNMTTISYQYTRKGQLWQAMVYPSDGYDSTYPTIPFESNILHIDNTLPEVRNVTISPSAPNGGDDLFVNYEVFDMDGDGLDSSKTSHRWYYYNEIIGDWEYFGIDSYYLPSQYTLKGQLWRCEVTPNDGDDYGSTNISQVVLIGNTPPTIQNPKIISETGNLLVTAMDNLKVVYNYTDVDGDNENGTTYEWYLQRDGGPWTKYTVNSNILPNSYTQREDLWRCRIIPMDGEDIGEEAWTDVVEIFNTPPMVFNVTILPQYATSGDTLKVTYDFYDYDGDEDNGTSFRWVFKDALGVGMESGISGNITPPSETKKGETWYCEVTPSDGINVGDYIRSSGVVIHNTPPYISDANIVIVTTDIDRYLMLSYTPEDIDGNDLDMVEVQWFVDGAVMSQFNNDQMIPGDNLFKGEKWNATLRVFDGEEWSDWYITDYVSIPNTPPKINGTVSLTRLKALSNEDLIPDYEDYYLDEDGDSLSSLKIKWYKDNGHMEDYDDLEEISWEFTKKGEIWFYKIRVYDGEDWSDWYSSSTSVIENSPPSNITLSSEVTIVTITETETWEFHASAEDMDEDPLSYRWTLDGRIVLLEEDVSKSIYLMKTDYESEGEYILRLVISDGDDTYENTWTINVHKKNRLPTISVVEPEGKSAKIKEKETLNFAITKSDPDGDNLDVSWYLDGSPTPVWEGSDKYTYSPDYYSSGSHNITAKVYEKDTGVNSTYTWDIDVEDVAAITEEFLGFSYDWWGLVLAIISGIAAILIFMFGFYRVRKKKSKLKEYMMEMDRIEEEEDPEVVEEKLTGLEIKIKEEFSQGKLEDLHFLMLQEIMAGKQGEFRKAEVTRRFGRLPKSILRDLDEMLKDGKIRREEYESFVSTISKTEGLSVQEKEELSRMIGEWEVEDKDSIKEGPLSEKVKPKKSKIDEDLEHMFNSLDEE